MDALSRTQLRSALPLPHAVELLADLRETVRRGVYFNRSTTGASLGRLHLLFLYVHRGGGFGAPRWSKWKEFLNARENPGILELDVDGGIVPPVC